MALVSVAASCSKSYNQEDDENHIEQKSTLGQWSEWSKCSATCGQGKQQCQRRWKIEGEFKYEETRACPSCKATLGECLNGLNGPNVQQLATKENKKDARLKAD